jgi:hypothetical protein
MNTQEVVVSNAIVEAGWTPEEAIQRAKNTPIPERRPSEFCQYAYGSRSSGKREPCIKCWVPRFEWMWKKCILSIAE